MAALTSSVSIAAPLPPPPRPQAAVARPSPQRILPRTVGSGSREVARRKRSNSALLIRFPILRGTQSATCPCRRFFTLLYCNASPRHCEERCFYFVSSHACSFCPLSSNLAAVPTGRAEYVVSGARLSLRVIRRANALQGQTHQPRGKKLSSRLGASTGASFQHRRPRKTRAAEDLSLHTHATLQSPARPSLSRHLRGGSRRSTPTSSAGRRPSSTPPASSPGNSSRSSRIRP